MDLLLIDIYQLADLHGVDAVQTGLAFYGMC